jgi:2-polyprenyl-6-methoxyphenol hydroxylase-like FAD-dependent oxidoreductase
MKAAIAARGRALIIGGSLGGLLTGNILHRTGWDVHVYERASEPLIGRGAGLVTHPELFEALARGGVVVDETIGVDVQGRVALDRQGKVIGERPLRQILTAWSRLYRLLTDAFPAERHHPGFALDRVEQTSSCVTAVFAHGERVSGDLLVGADGIRSTVRAQFLPEAAPVYAGYVAWRGLAEEQVLSPATHAAVFEKFAFCLPPGEQALGYPVAGAQDDTRPGRRRFNLVWYRPAEEATELRRLCTDASGRVHEFSIPPPLIRPEIIAELREAAGGLLAPQFAEMLHKTAQLFFQPIFDVESTHIAFGRVALLGDAAFVARPHVGMGVTKAGSDALALADALERSNGDVIEALAHYERERVAAGAVVVAHARRLGAYMQAQLRSEEERAMAERYRTPEAVMRETAVSPFAARL